MSARDVMGCCYSSYVRLSLGARTLAITPDGIGFAYLHGPRAHHGMGYKCVMHCEYACEPRCFMVGMYLCCGPHTAGLSVRVCVRKLPSQQQSQMNEQISEEIRAHLRIARRVTSVQERIALAAAL